MQARYPQADGRSVGRRKWSANMFGGPLIYFAELVLKRLIQHGFAASYEALGNAPIPVQVRFVNLLGPTPLFRSTLRLCLEVIARRCRVAFKETDGIVMLDAVYVLKFRWAKKSRSGKPVAASFVLAGSSVDPPF